jgi:hypothetical protein
MMITTTLRLVPFVALVVICGVLVLAGRITVTTDTGSARRRYWISVVRLAVVVGFVRGLCFCDITYRAFVRRESLSELPLIVLLCPELLVTPTDPVTPAGLWVLTGALVIGSFAMVSALAFVIWRYFGRAGTEGAA